MAPSWYNRSEIPRARENDYAPERITARQDFIREHTGSPAEHVAQYSLYPGTLRAGGPFKYTPAIASTGPQHRAR